MDKIQRSSKLKWLYGYMASGYIFTSLTLTLTLKIVYLDTTDILQLNYYVQHIGNKKNYIGCVKETI